MSYKFLIKIWKRYDKEILKFISREMNIRDSLVFMEYLNLMCLMRNVFTNSI